MGAVIVAPVRARQDNDMMQSDVGPFVFSVIDRNYLRLGEAWGREVRRVTGRAPSFVCADETARAFLSGQGFSCLSHLPEGELAADDRIVYGNSTFPSDKADSRCRSS
ncbi:hypothetical protein SAMN05421688_1145 [Poseidonocella pacifica]|uniref:Uncharacterized protein n=1 Tax=Poseidonocella pacifica TaxID=871651 RepID=A0A1I0W8I7_9RHOB|nr:hypothetical protein [Poseidonocella pacifica]SFA85045.1 hypothetical protein SAMN05421688_1145 [Poseidonocella pacifica]